MSDTDTQCRWPCCNHQMKVNRRITVRFRNQNTKPCHVQKVGQHATPARTRHAVHYIWQSNTQMRQNPSAACQPVREASSSC